eukprot:m.204366 g.204366  ORF g.204366 m.204366 type:complete len:303 (-) comp15009_c1_seq8:28-936(-)
MHLWFWNTNSIATSQQVANSDGRDRVLKHVGLWQQRDSRFKKAAVLFRGALRLARVAGSAVSMSWLESMLFQAVVSPTALPVAQLWQLAPNTFWPCFGKLMLLDVIDWAEASMPYGDQFAVRRIGFTFLTTFAGVGAMHVLPFAARLGVVPSVASFIQTGPFSPTSALTYPIAWLLASYNQLSACHDLLSTSKLLHLATLRVIAHSVEHAVPQLSVRSVLVTSLYNFSYLWELLYLVGDLKPENNMRSVMTFTSMFGIVIGMNMLFAAPHFLLDYVLPPENHGNQAQTAATPTSPQPNTSTA